MKRQSENPLLSIIIPVHNRQDELSRLFQVLNSSIKRGDHNQEIEVIIVDDCSSDPVTLMNEDQCNFRLISNLRNRGAPYSREKGLNQANGDFFHFHDSDDLITEEWLTEVINELKRTPELDILMTGRIDTDSHKTTFRYQKYFHKKTELPDKIRSRLIYRNCMGPLGGVTFSRRVLDKIEFKHFASCQDWQMYIDAINYSKLLISRPDITFIFNKTGDDRISGNPRKKIIGHLQLAKITSKESPFKKNIRLFYLYTCKQHIYNKGGSILKFYKKNRIRIIIAFLVISLYWRLT